MQQNLNFLVSEGVLLESISKLISLKPRSITYNVDRMVRALKICKAFRFSSSRFHAFDAILSMSESTMSMKTEFVKNLLGLSEEEVKSVFKRSPHCFKKSEGKMKLVANFFVNTVRVESSFVPSIPMYFSYSVDKRLVPWYNVYKTLESKKLLKKGVKFTATLKQSERCFESNFVVKYLDRVPNLMELYHGVSETSNTQSVIATKGVGTHCKVSQLKC